MSKATHRGTCQACGRLQKLPDGRLSTHGYTKRWGFFEGTCPGTGHEPFELSKDLIEGCITGAQGRLAGVLAFQKELRKPVAETATEAWVNEYVGHPFGYVWNKVALTHESKEHNYPGNDPFTSHEFYYIDHSKRRARLQFCPEYPKSILEVVTIQNEKRAKALDRDLGELRSYIKWQQGRIADWKPEPSKLQPVTK